jgi:hypothetical protein
MLPSHVIYLDDTGYTDPPNFNLFRFMNKEDEQNETRMLDIIISAQIS